ncbi:MAG: hypothetical protein QOE54_2565 [Streptosporangiaceae bacterium]|jgi:PAS domain S-box-containing protein|nr:hypothetical protein [Streptosporangiaceae bacterium]
MVRRPHIAAIERRTASLRVRIDLLRSVHQAQPYVSGDILDTTLAELEAATAELSACMDELDLQSEQVADLATGEHALLARILQDLPAAILVLDRQGIVRRANPRSATELGMTPANLLGKPLAALVDLQWRPALRSALSSVLRDGTTKSIDVRLGLASGTELSQLTFWPVTVLSRPESLVAVHALTPSPMTGTDRTPSAGLVTPRDITRP